MQKFFEEFKKFALKGNMFDMAVGIIIGGAFTSVVNALTDNIIKPLLNFLTGAAKYTWQDIGGFFSAFISSFVNFIIMAFVLFCLLKFINKLVTIGRKKDDEEEIKSKTKICPYCFSEIHIDATRCPNCTSELELKSKEENDEAESPA